MARALGTEACRYGWEGTYLTREDKAQAGERWSNDAWAWFIAHAVPWATERKFANTAILDKDAERRYWAGPFGLPLRPEAEEYDWRLWRSLFANSADGKDWIMFQAYRDQLRRFQ